MLMPFILVVEYRTGSVHAFGPCSRKRALRASGTLSDADAVDWNVVPLESMKALEPRTASFIGDDFSVEGFTRPYHGHPDGTRHAHPSGDKPHSHTRTPR